MTKCFSISTQFNVTRKNNINYEYLELCEAGSTGGPDVVCVTEWIYWYSHGQIKVAEHSFVGGQR